MDDFNVFARGDNQVINEEKPPPRECPRCNSENTKFCYYNNYSVSQPRYFCKNCRRYWTHGGALRNIPIGGSCRKPKRPLKMDQQVVSVDIQQVNHHHQPFLNVQETNEFLGSSHGINHGGIVTNVPQIRSSRLIMDRLDFSDVSYQQEYYDVGSNDLIGNPFINQSIGGSVVVSSGDNGYRVNQEDPNKWNPSFNNNNMNMNHNVNTSGNRGSSSNGHMNKIRNTCVFRPTYHLEKHGP